VRRSSDSGTADDCRSDCGCGNKSMTFKVLKQYMPILVCYNAPYFAPSYKAMFNIISRRISSIGLPLATDVSPTANLRSIAPKLKSIPSQEKKRREQFEKKQSLGVALT
jgi:hypothetical protein